MRASYRFYKSGANIGGIRHNRSGASSDLTPESVGENH